MREKRLDCVESGWKAGWSSWGIAADYSASGEIRRDRWSRTSRLEGNRSLGENLEVVLQWRWEAKEQEMWIYRVWEWCGGDDVQRESPNGASTVTDWKQSGPRIFWATALWRPARCYHIVGQIFWTERTTVFPTVCSDLEKASVVELVEFGELFYELNSGKMRRHLDCLVMDAGSLLET